MNLHIQGRKESAGEILQLYTGQGKNVEIHNTHTCTQCIGARVYTVPVAAKAPDCLTLSFSAGLAASANPATTSPCINISYYIALCFKKQVSN